MVYDMVLWALQLREEFGHSNHPPQTTRMAQYDVTATTVSPVVCIAGLMLQTASLSDLFGLDSIQTTTTTRCTSGGTCWQKMAMLTFQSYNCASLVGVWW